MSMTAKRQPQKRKEISGQRTSPRKPARRVYGLILAILLTVLILFVIRHWPGSSDQSAPADGRAGAGPSSATLALKGRWLRPDGGYVLEIKQIQKDGTMEANYFNPNPIHVAKASLSQSGAATRVFVELRDTGYPGSTYNLNYDPETDQLRGIYSQAAIHEDFEVVFRRLN